MQQQQRPLILVRVWQCSSSHFGCLVLDAGLDLCVIILNPCGNMISTQMIPENGTNRIINDENIHSNLSRQTNGNRDVLGKEKKVLADPSVVIVGAASVSPKKKLSVRDLAKAFQGKATNLSNVPMPMDGRSRSSSVPTGGMYPFSYPTLSNGLSHHYYYSNTNAYHVQPPPVSQGGWGRSRSSSVHEDTESHSATTSATASHHLHAAASFSPASAAYTHGSTASTSSQPSQYPLSMHSTGNFSCDSSGTRASSVESGVDYSAPVSFAERASMFARLAARAQPPLPQPQGDQFPLCLSSSFIPSYPSNNTLMAITTRPSPQDDVFHLHLHYHTHYKVYPLMTHF